MRNRIVWASLGFLLVLTMVLASCTAKTTTTATTVTTTSTTQVTTQVTTTATTTATTTTTTTTPASNMVTLNLTKLDGTKVTKTVEKPRYGGILVMGIFQDVQYFDEIYGMQPFANTMQLTNGELLQADWVRSFEGTGEAGWASPGFMPPLAMIRGGIAESWELSGPDTIVYHIRQGIHFQNKAPTNGRLLTADDVVYSLQRLWTVGTSYDKQSYPYLVDMTDVTKSIYATDQWTVIVKCIPGKAGYMFEMTSDHAQIIPKDMAEAHGGNINDWKLACGVGPFYLTDYVKGSSIHYERNTNYWMSDPLFPDNQLPYLDGVKQLIIPDMSTRMAALRVGKIDWLGGWDGYLTGEQTKSMKATNPELKSSSYFDGSIRVVFWRTDKAPFNDLQVRRALTMAVDSRSILKNLYGGQGELISIPLGPIPEFASAYTPLDQLPAETQQLFTYNPDEARKLLTAAGYPNGFTVSIDIQTGDEDYITLVAGYWAKVGVTLNINKFDPATQTTRAFSRTYEYMTTYPLNSYLCFKQLDTLPGGSLNFSFVNDKKLNDAYSAIGSNYFDEPLKLKLLKDLAPYYLSQAYSLQPPSEYKWTLWEPWVKGYQGEMYVGKSNIYDFPKYVWYDTALKQSVEK